MTVREKLNQGPLLFDGGMGTYYSVLNHSVGSGCELANLSQPELIEQIHREYLEAGSQAIKTNTFAANRVTFQGNDSLVRRTIQAGWDIACRAAKPSGAFVFADIGPVSGLTREEKLAEYQFLAETFLTLGADCFLFETLADLDGICEAAAYIRERRPDAYIITSFAVLPDGFTREGIYVNKLIQAVKACGQVDAFGLNCVCGAPHMLELLDRIQSDGITLSVMPNAGYPTVINNRTFYDGDPVYYAAQLKAMAEKGARIFGGCCGTTPVHIARLREKLAGYLPAEVHQSAQTPQKSGSVVTESPFWQKLQRGEKVLAVELDPPKDTLLDKFLAGAGELKQAGVDIITIADCPIARARMDSSLLACKLKRELGVEALPHMTCRDRNLNATKALLLGLHAEGIRNVLLVTGDPIPTPERDEVKSVYQFNSRKLAAFVHALGEQELPSPFHLFGALDVNARNFEVQLRLAKEKIGKGIIGFLTQPVLTPQAFEHLQQARRELDAYILGGIIPVVSERNARFMDNEINGIRVDPKITELYAGKNREEGEELAVAISSEIARRIAPFVDGYYLMTPFMRTGLICRIIDQIGK